MPVNKRHNQLSQRAGGRFLAWGLSCVIGLLLLLSASARGQDMRIAMVADAPMQLIACRVMEKVYARLNLALEPVPLPGKRALQASNSGDVDGELLRISAIKQRYSNLVQVPESYLMMQGMVFSRAGLPPMSRWQDLAPYRVGVVRGVHYSREGTEGMNRIVASDVPQLFDLLDRGRVDLIVTAKLNGAIEMLRRPEASFVLHPIPLFEEPLYHFLHREHRALVPGLDREIRALKSSGELERWVDEAIAETALSTRKHVRTGQGG
ncbi:substrate-binding periplasmic protein [Aestuariirhabdus sp. LZHN29]|uniref:substrate-binding periplasmic protein n=1 Tax=Aestuariirhabdus sp. LZHN29 TaxID=3417462 RepID=UPI003CF320B1